MGESGRLGRENPLLGHGLTAEFGGAIDDMPTLTAERGVEPWRRRLYLPTFRVADAARYSNVSPQVVTNWGRRNVAEGPPPLPGRAPGERLSYLQLVEVAFVAIFRRLGVSLDTIARTRGYMRQTFSSEYPFAQYSFKTDGVRMLLRWVEYEDVPELNEVIVADVGGQLGWEALMAARLAEFDYEHDLALVWHVAGRRSPVKIDPRISFGAPTVSGVQTWALKGRWTAGGGVSDMVEDFAIDEASVVAGLQFEGVYTGCDTVLR